MTEMMMKKKEEEAIVKLNVADCLNNFCDNGENPNEIFNSISVRAKKFA